LQSPLASLDSSALDPVLLAIAAGALLATFLIGLAFGRASSRRTAERARDLEDRLQLAEEEMNQYRAQVSDHFSDTSKLLRDLTLQYRNVYEHLAEGARTLCPEAGRLLPSSFAEAALPTASEATGIRAADLASDDQLALELDNAEEWHEHAGEPAPSIEPLLEERVDEEMDTLDEQRAAESDARSQ